ncbi:MULTISPECIES: YczE/YyaS/YitT family protein [Helcococcus]|uniref:YitT family protein n=1 Tax=Helcococcus bovis TaxID=3153252 RepID=A0ABW9F6H8_9FIRM
MIKRFLAMLLCICIIGMGIALSIKSGIGLGPYDALSTTLSNISLIKVGTITIIINGTCILLQILLLGKNFNKFQYLQVIVIFVLGYVINIFYYNVFTFEVNSYIQRVLLFILATAICGFAVGAIMNINVVYTALEGFLDALAIKTNGDFLKYRWVFDVIAVVMCLLLSYIFNSEYIIREGTIIALIIFSPILGVSMKFQYPYFKKWGLLPVDKKIC